MASGTAAWAVEIHAEMAPLQAEWDALVSGETASPFQSFAFMREFYRQLAANGTAEPVIALVRDRDGRPVALFPMMRLRQNGLRWLRTDARPIDYCSPVIDAGVAAEALPGLVRAVLSATPEVDLLYCNRLAERFGSRANPMVGLPNAGRLRLSAWVIELQGRTAEELVGAQNANFRGNLRRSIQKLGREHQRRFEIAEGAEISEDDIVAFQALRAESCAEKGMSNIMEDPDWAPLYQTLMRKPEAPFRPWLAKLLADDEPIAYCYGVAANGRAVATHPVAKLGSWKGYSPGLQLFHDTILHFHAAGLDQFDLSIGDMPYKRRFGCVEIGLHDALFAKTPAGYAYYLLWRLKVAIRARMKPMTPAA